MKLKQNIRSLNYQDKLQSMEVAEGTDKCKKYGKQKALNVVSNIRKIYNKFDWLNIPIRRQDFNWVVSQGQC